MVIRSHHRRAAPARAAGRTAAALAAMLIGAVGLAACGTAHAGQSLAPGVDPGGPDVNVVSPAPTGTPSQQPLPGVPGSPATAPATGTLVVIATVGAPIVGLDTIRVPTPAGLVAVTTWVRVDRVISGRASTGQRLRIFQIVRQQVQMEGVPTPAAVLPALVTGHVYELWLRPLTMNDKAVPGTWVVSRERSLTAS